MTYIIGISGISGAGKTTLTKYLGEKLKATTVFWDDYDEISVGPDDLVKWYEESKDYKTWDYDDLAKTLQGLKNGKTFRCPATQKELKPTPYVIVDAPLGRKHLQTSQHIDLCIHIDVPLDMALARRVLRDFKDENRNKEELLEDIDFYINHSRKLFTLEEIKTSADFVIEGVLSCEEQANAILAFLSKEKNSIPQTRG